MVGFRFGNEQVSGARVPFTGDITGNNLRNNPRTDPG
jgi:hypothetical protein